MVDFDKLVCEVLSKLVSVPSSDVKAFSFALNSAAHAVRKIEHSLKMNDSRGIKRGIEDLLVNIADMVDAVVPRSGKRLRNLARKVPEVYFDADALYSILMDIKSIELSLQALMFGTEDFYNAMGDLFLAVYELLSSMETEYANDVDIEFKRILRKLKEV